MKIIRLLIPLFCLLPGLLMANEPKTVMGKPKAFDLPEDLPGLENMLAEPQRMPWVVINDRADNQTYEKDGTPKTKINFRDWFYVVESDGQRIRIGKAQLEGRDGKQIVKGSYQDYGWVDKGMMLLWTSALIDSKTKINRKAFLLNKAKDIDIILKSKNERDVMVYHGPNRAAVGEVKTIYEFYFVYKYDSKTQRYLLGREAKIATQTANDVLIGWVEERRVEKWDTRLALEPNYQPEAFAERQSRQVFQVCAYGNQADAETHAVSGKRVPESIYWDKDPVSLKNREHLANTNNKRFKGGVVRFPLFTCSNSHYRTGVVGEITYQTAKGELEKMDEVYYTHLVDELQKKETGKHNYDILFVVEGTKNLGSYREAIIQSMKKIREELVNVSLVRFGVSIYRDIPEEKVGKLHTYKRFDQNIDEVAKFLNNAEFARWEDNDPWTAMYYGIRQGFRECGMNSANTNIVFVLGNYADFSGYQVRKDRDISHRATVLEDDLANEMAKFNIHLVGIQIQNVGDRCAKKYQDQMHNLIVQSGITQFQKYRNTATVVDSRLDIGNPFMPELDAGNELFLENGCAFGMLRKPNSNSALSDQDVINATQTATKRVYRKVEGMWEKLKLVVEDGASFQEVNPGDFAEPMLHLFAKLKAEGKYNDEDLMRIVAKKYKLYAEVFIPRKIQQATHISCSVVLFMSERDLTEYLNVIRRLTTCMDNPPDVQRKCLYDTFVELVGQFTGNTKDPQTYTVDRLRNVMQGLSDQSCDLPSRWGDIRIEDILNRRKMPDEEVRKRIEEIVRNTKNLQEISNEGRNHEFAFKTSSEVYFWIPLEYTF